MAPFSEELTIDAAGVPLSLASLTGACTAGELRLASDSLPFGVVALGSRTAKRLALCNTGDVGARFAWDCKALGPHFSIIPAGVWGLPACMYALLGAAARLTAASVDCSHCILSSSFLMPKSQA